MSVVYDAKTKNQEDTHGIVCELWHRMYGVLFLGFGSLLLLLRGNYTLFVLHLHLMTIAFPAACFARASKNHCNKKYIKDIRLIICCVPHDVAGYKKYRHRA